MEAAKRDWWHGGGLAVRAADQAEERERERTGREGGKAEREREMRAKERGCERRRREYGLGIGAAVGDADEVVGGGGGAAVAERKQRSERKRNCAKTGKFKGGSQSGGFWRRLGDEDGGK